MNLQQDNDCTLGRDADSGGGADALDGGAALGGGGGTTALGRVAELLGREEPDGASSVRSMHPTALFDVKLSINSLKAMAFLHVSYLFRT